MPNYKNGKIYKIISKDSNLIYIGSTCNCLKNRKQQHEYSMIQYLKDENYKKIIVSWKLMIFEDAEIQLIEKYPCNSKIELEKRERYYIEKEGLDFVVNQKLPANTLKNLKKNAKKHRRERYLNLTLEDKKIISEKAKKKYKEDEEHRKKLLDKVKQRNKDFKAEKSIYNKKHRNWVISWGGDYRNNNNLLQIKI